MLIKGGMIFQDNKTFAKKDIYIENGRIIAITEPGMENTDIQQADDRQVYDATGLFVLPGLIDIHSHGAMGHDFCDGNLEGVQEILKYQYAHGVTSYCPTSMSLPKERLLELFTKAGKWKEGITEKRQYSRILGYNMEGPFLDPEKKGAHKKENIMPPDAELFRNCNEACRNQIRLVTVAPNKEGAMELIEEICHNTEVTIALGHTAADYATCKEAFQKGASHITHLFNAMEPFNHRVPGLIGAAAEEENCMVELICDGIHVHESMVRAAFKLFSGRIVLISDSMRATGLSDGTYELGGQQVSVTKNRATLSDDTIAGSVTDLFDCMRTAISFGIALEEAIAAATMNPAKSIGVYDKVGSLTVGKSADIVLVDRDFKLVKVI